jgi:hypothetical protein
MSEFNTIVLVPVDTDIKGEYDFSKRASTTRNAGQRTLLVISKCDMLDDDKAELKKN